MRSRSAAARAPKDDSAALVLATRRAALDAEIAGHEAERTAAIAAANAAADAAISPKLAELKDADKQLKAWWPGAADRLTGGKRKSIEFGGLHIGTRTSKPKLVFTGGKDADMVAAIQATGSRRLRTLLVRIKPAPEKAVILKLLGIGDKLADRLRSLGFSAPQDEEFFIDRIGSDALRVDA